eukprot:g39281.t1
MTLSQTIVVEGTKLAGNIIANSVVFTYKHPTFILASLGIIRYPRTTAVVSLGVSAIVVSTCQAGGVIPALIGVPAHTDLSGWRVPLLREEHPARGGGCATST